MINYMLCSKMNSLVTIQQLPAFTARDWPGIEQLRSSNHCALTGI